MASVESHRIMNMDQNPHYAPQFRDPWGSQQPSYNNLMGSTVSMPYSSIPVSAPSIPASYGPTDQSMMRSYSTEQSYTAPTATSNIYAANPLTGFEAPYGAGRQFAMQQSTDNRRLSQPSANASSFMASPLNGRTQQRQNSLIDLNRGMTLPEARGNFTDTLDAGRGMVAMSQDATPRAAPGRNSADSYGFPTTHSTSSSISSQGAYVPTYFGSVDSSSTDYSSNSEMGDSAPSARTLPRLSGLLGNNMPPAPQSMMSQFSSKMSSSTQKKHKCKICDKRFTRPSSLQTHMYSHTGEKRKSYQAHSFDK
jgi:Zinc finger, C2H2 type